MKPLNMKAIVAAYVIGSVVTLLPFPAFAKITALRREFNNLNFFITIYDDGSPARLGTSIGIGDRARAYSDTRTGALVVVEVNTDGIPTTITTIQPDRKAFHSRHLIGPFGEVMAPEQRIGQCNQVAL
jgi:hypothetical protein